MNQKQLGIYALSGILSGLCIYSWPTLFFGPGAIFGFFFSINQPILKSIFKKIVFVLSSALIYYLALMIAAGKYDLLKTLFPNGEIKFFIAGSFGASTLCVVIFLLNKRSINLTNSFYTTLVGGVVGALFILGDKFEESFQLVWISTFALWQLLIGIGLNRSIKQR